MDVFKLRHMLEGEEMRLSKKQSAYAEDPPWPQNDPGISPGPIKKCLVLRASFVKEASALSVVSRSRVVPTRTPCRVRN